MWTETTTVGMWTEATTVNMWTEDTTVGIYTTFPPKWSQAARVGVGRWQGKARVVITAVAIYILTHIIAIIG